MTNEIKSSALIAKQRFLHLKPTNKDPKGEAMINGYGCTKEQYELWLTSPLVQQIKLEMEWGFLWREAYPLNPVEPTVALSIEATLAQRGSRYGDFSIHALICQQLMAVMFGTSAYQRGWKELTDVQKQALTVIADKIARILSGDPNYDDNWHDIQGYAKLVENSLPCNQAKKES